jgi:hypothetical protein
MYDGNVILEGTTDWYSFEQTFPLTDGIYVLYINTLSLQLEGSTRCAKFLNDFHEQGFRHTIDRGLS